MVEQLDINVAVGLLNESIFQEVKEKVDEKEEDEDEDMYDETQGSIGAKTNQNSSSYTRSQRYATRTNGSPVKEEQITPTKKTTRSSATSAIVKSPPAVEDTRPTKRVKTSTTSSTIVEKTTPSKTDDELGKLFAAP